MKGSISVGFRGYRGALQKTNDRWTCIRMAVTFNLIVKKSFIKVKGWFIRK